MEPINTFYVELETKTVSWSDGFTNVHQRFRQEQNQLGALQCADDRSRTTTQFFTWRHIAREANWCWTYWTSYPRTPFFTRLLRAITLFAWRIRCSKELPDCWEWGTTMVSPLCFGPPGMVRMRFLIIYLGRLPVMIRLALQRTDKTTVLHMAILSQHYG